ncbi:MAG: hypothetical protein K5874_07275 [Bacteroidaceae bacterium]|nr:hypothetical protein [Bacteroidaceae bacterium]
MCKKTQKKILVCMLWLCAIACFTGFPWMFFSWDIIHTYMQIYDKTSDMTSVLFRQECLYFGFFFIYFLFLRNVVKYKELIRHCTFLVAFMGLFMYLLKLQTGIVHVSSDYEPFIWLVIGSFMFYLNQKIEGIKPERQTFPVLTLVLRILAGVLLLNLFCLFLPQQAWDAMFKVPFSSVSTYDRYTFGMVSGFTAFSSVIIFYISNRVRFYMNLSRAILIFSFLYIIGFVVWGNFMELYKPIFIVYLILVESLIVISICYIFKKNTYGK